MNFLNIQQKLNSEHRTALSKNLYTFILLLFITTSAFAQRVDREKIKALKIAHITEQLDLSKDEAQKFWPIYNANEEAENQIRIKSGELRKDNTSKDLSESEAKALLINMISIEEQKVELRSKMMTDLLEILPATKIIKLIQTEKSFKRKMLQEFKSRHAGMERKN